MKLPHLTLSYGDHLRPVRDWVVLLMSAGVCIVASLVWNLWLFNRVVSGEVLGDAPKAGEAIVDETLTSTLSKVLIDREAARVEYEDGTKHFVDPSL